MDTEYLRAEQRVSLELKSLYLSYGFSEYKLSGFEEYSLYAENQSFLSGKDVITFNLGGKLLALRPDVTLSVVKNVAADRSTQKLFYDEKVYRNNGRGGFSELNQIGVEVIGAVDPALEAELVVLMLKTLSASGANYLLDISHIGVIVAMLDGMDLSGGDREFAVDCLKRKDKHDFLEFAKSRAVDEKRAQAFANLMNLPAGHDSALEALRSFAPVEALSCIDELEKLISLVGSDKININFSVDGDADYYNGLIFKGYVEGVPRAVLSGGRYDKLLSKFGKSGQAVGFALYLGELAVLFDEYPVSPDVAVVYSDYSSKTALNICEKYRADGLKVLMTRSVPANFRGKIINAEDEK